MTSLELKSVPRLTVMMASLRPFCVPCPTAVMTSLHLYVLTCPTVVTTSSKLQFVARPVIMMTSLHLQAVTCPTVVMMSSKIQYVPRPAILMTSLHLQAVTSQTSVDVPKDVAPQSRKLQDETKVIDINFCRYEIGCQLGKVGFGTIYAATRLDDGLQVALKFASNRNKKFFIIDGYSRPLPLEVALLILASQDPSVPEIVQLLDWRVQPDHYVLVLERPMPFEELNWFVLQQIVTMEEDVARVIMHQAIFAAQTCCRRGVLHRENLLINPDTLKVKLIDFGCGDFLTDEAYTSYAGTKEYCPPEYLMTGKYHGEPATVWSLGILLFAFLCGDYPKIQDLKKINSNTWAKEGLSKECCNIICCCLQIDPQQRIELGKHSLHNWFKTADKKK